MSEHIKSYLITIEKYSRIIGMIMYVISVIFTINMMLTFGSSGREKVLYVFFAVCIQSCQLIALGISFILSYIGQQAKSKMFFMAFIYLFILSLLGTVGFFAVSQRENQNKAFNTDKKYAEMKAQLDDYDKRIAKTDRQIEVFASKGIVSKGVTPLREEKAELTGKRDKLSEDIKNYKPEATSDALYSSLSDFLDVPPDSLKLGLNFAYALILELMSAGLLWFSFFLKFQVLGNERKAESYDKEDSIKPVMTKQDKPFYIPNPSNSPMSFQDTDKEAYIQYLLKENQLLKQNRNKQVIDSENNTIQIKQKPVLNQTEVIENTVKDNPIQYDTNTIQYSIGKDKPAIQYDTIQSIDKDVIIAYLNEAFNKQKADGALQGRRGIADSLKFSNKTVDLIHTFLKNKGFIKVENRQTYPIMSKEQILNAIIGNSKQAITATGIGF